jgi:hypothetical protein
LQKNHWYSIIEVGFADFTDTFALHFGNWLPGTKLSHFQIKFKVEQQFLNEVSGGKKMHLTDFMTELKQNKTSTNVMDANIIVSSESVLAKLLVVFQSPNVRMCHNFKN